MFDLLLRWFQPEARPAQPAAAPLPAADEEPVFGCGWFDSSHDLVCGAHVVEVDDASVPLWHCEFLAQA